MAEGKGIALYMRISKEDEKAPENNFGEDESNSIGNQRKLLSGFLKKKQEFTESPVFQYIDDGYSGTEFERPGFVEMMGDIKKGKIQCVIVKDFSRFGRDYMEVGDYIEHIFPFMQVRFISVNDGYDSKNYRGKTPDIDVPFRNLAYALYSQDISDKIKSSLAARQKKGLYIGSLPPFGYQKDESGFLTPDEETKAVVQRIYREYLSGTGLAQLAGKLNQEGIPSPKQHKINKGILRENKGRTYAWLPTTIQQILRSEIYIGTVSSGAYKNGPLGSGKRVFVPEEERIHVTDVHPPIIDKETFQKVQEKMNTKRKGEEHTFLLKGLVRCGECGRTMAREKGKFRCRYQKFTEHNPIGFFPEKELEEIVRTAVYTQLTVLTDADALSGRERELCEKKRKKLAREMKSRKLQVRKNKAAGIACYCRYRRGEIGRQAYLAQKQQEEEGTQKAEEELLMLMEEWEKLEEKITGIRPKWEEQTQCIMDKESERKLFLALLEEICVYGGKRVEVRWHVR